MDTFFARNRLSAYLDGSLTPGEAAEVESAIAEDPGLRSEYEDMRRTVSLLRRLGPAEAPPGFQARVMARIEAEPAPGGVVSLFRRTFDRVPIEALALAAAAVIVVLVIQGRKDEVPTDGGTSQEQEEAAALEAVLPATAERAATGEDKAQALAQNPLAPPSAADPSADGDLRTVGKDAPEVAPAGRAPDLSQTKVMSKSMPLAGESPYMADWELQGNASAGYDNSGGSLAELNSGIELAGPLAWRVSTDDPEVLYQLADIAEKSGGRLTDSGGSALAARELGQDDGWMQVHVVVPRDRVSAVQSRLSGMGGVPMPPPADNVLAGAEHAVFIVEIHR